MEYLPSLLPSDYESAQPILEEEFRRIQEAFTQGLYLPSLTAAPLNPREGFTVWADGTNWDPGSGAGGYRYNGSSWVKIF